MTDTATPPADSGFQVRGWHVLVAVVAFFGIVIAVDVAMMVMAYRSFPGQSAANPYEAGLAYNRTLAKREAEARLGWTGAAETLPDGGVRLTLKDAAGAPLRGVAIQGVLQRPATAQGGVTVRLRETRPGVYEASQAVPAGGAWDLSVTARSARDQALDIEQRLVWP